MNIKTKVFCTFRLGGIHHWPECPFDDVFYLRTLHRHEFYFRCETVVTHSDRDVEFIRQKQEIIQYLLFRYWDNQLGCLNFGRMSCEMIAQELCTQFSLIRCEVSEDNENGAVVTVEE